jgi:hypothetical protein
MPPVRFNDRDMSRIFPPANSILPLAVRYEFPAEFMQAYNRNRVLYLIEDGRLWLAGQETLGFKAMFESQNSENILMRCSPRCGLRQSTCQ